MSQAREPSTALGKALLSLPGLQYEIGARLAPHTTLQVGGPAEALVTVSTEDALMDLLKLARRRGWPLQLLGLGSNVLIPDDGLAGVTLRLDGDFKRIQVHGGKVRAGAALPLSQLARRMAARGLCGLEALSGFPSTVGGAVFMNAGCYGTEISDLLTAVSAVDPDGSRRQLSMADLEAGYRSTRLQLDGTIVTAATLQLQRGDRERALRRIAEFSRRRRQSMPGVANAGSIFRNPDTDYAGRLIEQAGLKGVRAGQAQISIEHANVVVNLGGARAQDVIELMLLMYRRVLETSGIVLEPELVLTGSLLEQWQSAR